MAFDLTPVVIVIVVALAVALLVLIILTLTYLKSRRRLIESRREARVRRQRRVKFSDEVGRSATSAVKADNSAAIDDLPDAEHQTPLYRPVHAIGIQNGRGSQRQMYLPSVPRGSLWARDLDQQQPPDAAAFSWPMQAPALAPGDNVYRPSLLTPEQLPQQQQQQQQQIRQGFRDIVTDVDISDASRSRRVVYNDENDEPNWQESRNNNLLPVVSLQNRVSSFQTPVVIVENPPLRVPNFQQDNRTALQMPAAVASTIEPVSSAPFLAVHQPVPVPAPVQLASSSATPALAAVQDNVATETAEVSWSVVDDADGSNGWSSSTSGYMQMTGRAGVGGPSSSAAVFTPRPVPAVRQSILASSTAGNFGGGAGSAWRQFEEQEQSASMSTSGTIQLPVPPVRRSILAASTAQNFGGGAGSDGRQFEDQEQSVSMSGSGTVHFR